MGRTFYLIALSLCVLYVDIVRHPQWEEHGMSTQTRKANMLQYSPTIR